MYDAYGQMLAIMNGTGTLLSGGNGPFADAKLAAPNLLYSGEQFDTRIGQQYLRARYLNPSTGRFNRLDPFFGNKSDPQSFNKYLYTHADPVNGVDSTGLFLIAGMLFGMGFGLSLSQFVLGKQIIEPISERDWAVLKTHTRRGESLLHDRTSPLLMLAARIAQTHHEKWDGSGYPRGLSGKDIPLEGRIVAIADVFDALSSSRPYKKAFSREVCFEILESGRGQHFDPDILDAFFKCSDHIVEIQIQLMDEENRITGEKYVSDDLSPAACD